MAAATALSKLYKLHHRLGERIFEADLRDVSYLSRCLDDVLMCGQRRAVVLTGAHGYNLLMTKILFETYPKDNRTAPLQTVPPAEVEVERSTNKSNERYE